METAFLSGVQKRRAVWFQYRALCSFALALGIGLYIGELLIRTWLFAALCVFLAFTFLLVLTDRPRAALFMAALALGLFRAGLMRFPLFLPAPLSVNDLFEPLRASLFSASDALFKHNAGIIKGMLFGYRSEMDAQTLQAFRATGLAHILALSGLNVSLNAFLLLLLIPKRCRKTRFYGVGAFSFIYCAVAAFPASLVRAAVMTQCLLLAGVFKRRNDIFSSLSLAGIVILLVDPAQLYDIGFQLSFAAVYAIALFHAPLSRRLSFFGKEISESISLTVCGTLGTLPLNAHYFGSVAWLTLFSNVLVLPIASAGLILSLIAVLLYFIWPFGASLLAFLGDASAGAMVYAARLIARLPFAFSYFARVPFITVLFLFAAMALLSRYNLQKPSIKRLAGGGALLCAALSMLVL